MARKKKSQRSKRRQGHQERGAQPQADTLTSSSKLERRRQTRREKLQERATQLKELKAIEGGRDFSARTKGWWVKVKDKSDQLWSWYRDLSAIKKVLWGLIVIPVVVVIVGVNVLLAPIIAPLLPLIGAGLITLMKLTFVLTKFGAFAVYIGYKVLKGCLGIYYCVSRSLTGLRAGRLRAELATQPLSVERAEALGLTLDERLAPLSCEVSWKRMTISGQAALQHPLLLSYLRYFILGQIFMYVESWKERRAFFTIWRADSRERIKDQFAFVGTTIFRPYALGPHVTQDRILLPGDARISSIQIASPERDTPHVTYTIEVPWRTWSVNRRWPFAHSELHHAQWALTLPLTLSELSEEELNWRTDAVLETGEPVVEQVEGQEDLAS